MMQEHKSTLAQSHFQGVARKVDIRFDHYFEVLTFRLELADSDGNILSYKAVELSGTKIFGVISDGDTVEVVGQETKTGLFQPKRLYNLSTGAEITTNSLTARTPLTPKHELTRKNELLISLLITILGSVALFYIFSRANASKKLVKPCPSLSSVHLGRSTQTQ